MDDFERRLSASMRSAVERPVDAEGSADRHRWPKAGGAAAVLVAAVVVSVFVLTGGSSDKEGVPLGPPAAIPPLQCPQQLAQASDQTHGFGPEYFATRPVRLPEPEIGVICIYTAHAEEPARGQGAVFRWTFGSAGLARNSPSSATATKVAPAQLSVLASDLSRVEPPHPSPGFGCTDELGPRYVLLYRAGLRTIGVVVDGYGCNEVRLTSDLKGVVAGTDDRFGTGFLFGPPSLIEHLRRFTGGRR